MTPFEATSQSVIELAVRSLASAPHFTAAERKTRTEAVVCAIMAFLPFEPVQTMLASQAVGHHVSLMDTFEEINGRAMSQSMSLATRKVSIAQTRIVLKLVDKLGEVRRDMLAAAEAERVAMQALANAAELQKAEAPPPSTPDSQASRGKAGTTAEATKAPAQSATLVTQTAEASPKKTEAAGGAKAARSETPAAQGIVAQGTTQEVDDATFLAHIAEFQEAFESTTAILAELGHLDQSNVDTVRGFLKSITPRSVAPAVTAAGATVVNNAV
jgi:hypothetical protein